MGWVVSVDFFRGGCFIILMNWAMVYPVTVEKEPSSRVPLFGGLTAGAGLGTRPARSADTFRWVPLVSDTGCPPCLLHMARALGTGRGKREPGA